MEQRLCDWPAGAEGAPKAITRLEGQIEEQVEIFFLKYLPSSQFKQGARSEEFYRLAIRTR